MHEVRTQARPMRAPARIGRLMSIVDTRRSNVAAGVDLSPFGAVAPPRLRGGGAAVRCGHPAAAGRGSGVVAAFLPGGAPTAARLDGAAIGSRDDAQSTRLARAQGAAGWEIAGAETAAVHRGAADASHWTTEVTAG